ncbi:MAG: hypothetical protein AB1384_01740 [Actinomycetota bacterium]
MEDLFFGDGWLTDLLKQARVPAGIKDRVRKKIQSLVEQKKGTWEADWSSIDRALSEGEVGKALEGAMISLDGTVEILSEMLGEERAALEKPFSPFMVRSREIRKILHPPEDLRELIESDDDLDAVISLEMINDARRLLASWGARVWGEEPLELIQRLEQDLEDLRASQAALEDTEYAEEEDIEREIELADGFATMATRFARDLLELHLLNAANPEVGMRFVLLWETVKQLRDDGDIPAAAFEALQVLEEALGLAGLTGGELLQRVDLLYDNFGDAEELRRAADHLVSVSRDGDGVISPEEGRVYIETMESALGDMGLRVG